MWLSPELLAVLYLPLSTGSAVVTATVVTLSLILSVGIAFIVESMLEKKRG
jgi:hypothetical protein